MVKKADKRLSKKTIPVVIPTGPTDEELKQIKDKSKAYVKKNLQQLYKIEEKPSKRKTIWNEEKKTTGKPSEFE